MSLPIMPPITHTAMDKLLPTLERQVRLADFRLSDELGAHSYPRGLAGYWWRCERGIVWIPAISATRPGSGACSKFLDWLPRDTCIVFSCVINPKLADMLARRGWRRIAIWVEMYGEWDADAWMRPNGRDWPDRWRDLTEREQSKS